VNKLAVAIATWFGCGYFPAAPGTVGSLAALVIAAILISRAGWPPWYFTVLAVLILAPSIWAAGVTARLRGEKDPGVVVVDEVIGQWLTLSGMASVNWKAYLGAFVLFRIFDVWKPVPIRQLEALPGGVGIVADDVLAGVYAALVLFLAGCFNLY
jgi:phosphatidylglycerophosphatase A